MYVRLFLPDDTVRTYQQHQTVLLPDESPDHVGRLVRSNIHDIGRNHEYMTTATTTAVRSYYIFFNFSNSNFELVFVSRNPPDSSKEICYGDLVTGQF